MQVSKGFAGALVAILGAVILGILLWPSSGDAALDRWDAGAAAQVHTHDAFMARTQGAQRRIAHLETVSGALQDEVDSLTDVTDSLDSLSRFLAAKGDTAAALVVLRQAQKGCSLALAVCKQRGDSLAAGLDTARAALFTATARVATDDSLLKVGVTVTDCRVLLLKCPTRKEAFEAGTGLGVLLVVLLRIALGR